MKTIYLILLILLIPSAVAETSIVNNKTVTPAVVERGIILNETNYVQYKYETITSPTLKSGEYIVLYDDINSVLKGAKYQDGVFINPKPVVTVDYEEIELKAEKSPIDPTQTLISGLAGAGAAYFMVRRKKT